MRITRYCSISRRVIRSLRKQRLDDVVDVEVAYVLVRLADADEDDRFPRREHKRERRADLFSA